MGDEEVLGGWVKKNLEAGDSPKVLKEVLKMRGYDTRLVDIVLKSGIIRKKESASKNVSEPKFCNTELKTEVEAIMSAKPAEPSATVPAVSPKMQGGGEIVPAQPSLEVFKSGLAPRVSYGKYFSDKVGRLFRGILEFLGSIQIPQAPKLRIPFPNLSFGESDFKIIRYAVAVSIFVAILAAVFYGLDWYADRAAKNLLSGAILKLPSFMH